MIANLMRQLLTEPLLLEPRTGAMLARILVRKMTGERFLGTELHAELGIAMPGRRGASAQPRIAVIPIVGIIAQRVSSLGPSTEEIGAAFAAALASEVVDAILLDVDSPGGTVNGVPELAERIRAARGVKPTLAIANGLAASAAYWIASAADEVWVTPSGETGSIGVYTIHEDWTKNLEQDGITITTISAGRFKMEGAPWLALSEDAKQVLVERVDEVYGWFIKAVAAGRRDTQTNVRAGYGEGRVLGAEQSVQAHLADRVGTFEEAVARLATKVSSRSGARAETLQRKLALDTARVAP